MFKPRINPLNLLPQDREDLLDPMTDRVLEGAKPCPFCANERIEVLIQDLGTVGHAWMIRCSECRANRVVVTDFRTQLLAEWNTRRSP